MSGIVLLLIAFILDLALLNGLLTKIVLYLFVVVLIISLTILGIASLTGATT